MTVKKMRVWGILGLFSPLLGLALAAILFTAMLNLPGLAADILFYLAAASAVLPVILGIPGGIILLVKARHAAFKENPSAPSGGKFHLLWIIVAMLGLFLFTVLIKILVSGLAKAMPV